MSRWLKSLLAGVATGVIGGFIGLGAFGSMLEQQVGLTWLFRVRGPLPAPAEVVVVAINEATARDLGLPPLLRDWPRAIHGRLIDTLVAGGAAVIVFDVNFEHPRDPDQDAQLARAVARSGRVVLFEKLDGRREPVLDGTGQQSGWVWREEVVPPLPLLAAAARGLGPFPVPKVQVNVFEFWAFKPSVGEAATLPVVALQVHALPVYERWLALLAQAGAATSAELPRRADELMSATALRTLMRSVRRAFKTDPALGARLHAQLAAETDLSPADERQLRALTGLYAGADNRYLNFYGPPGSIPTIPYAAVLTGTAPAMSGKTVFVGLSDLYAPDQPDRFYTVFSRRDGVDLSGVEIAATAFANLLTERTLKAVSPATTATVLLLFGLLLGAVVYRLPALLGVPAALALTGLYLVAVQTTFNSADLWLPLATPVLVQLPLALLVGLLGQYLLERRLGRYFSKAVSYYLPANVLKELTKKELTEKELDPNSLNKVVYGVCFATDMSGFTSISQSLAPNELAKFMNAYFDTLAKALNLHHVDVTEFHADTIMCAWTAERPEQLDRHSALLAGLALLDAVSLFKKSLDGIELYARVGLDEGRFYLGHTGGGGRFGYSILGDCANTAARLESLNKHLGTHILASQSVVKDCDDLLLRPLGRFVLVGKATPLPVVEIMAEQSKAAPSQVQLCARFAEALALFGREQWDEAGQAFAALLADYPDDGPARFYLARCQSYVTQAPPVAEPAVIYMNAK